MNKVSFVFSASYGSWSDHEKYLPAIHLLGEHFCTAYGIVYPRGSEWIREDPLDKMVLTAIPSRYVRRIVTLFSNVFHYPKYYSYMCNYDLCDRMFARRAAADDSKIVLTSGLMLRTVRRCKERGKTVVLIAGNSEAMREHRRVMEEYDFFSIKNRYIYGDPKFENRIHESNQMADVLINITGVSRKTYLDAGYPPQKLKLISMAGSNFRVHRARDVFGKQKAFISCAFHNFIKGTHRLLLAWRKARIRDIPLIIVGRLCEDMEEFIKKNGPFENVIFAGHQSALWDWYEQFDAVGILMSLSEGAVRVTPEMMSFGFPMVVSPDAACDIVRDGENGYIIGTLDEEALAERLRWFAEDWERVHAMRRTALESISHRTMTDFSRELGEYLLSLC